MNLLQAALETLVVLVGLLLAGFWITANYWFQRSITVARRGLREKLRKRTGEPVAIVVAARDEEKRLPLLLAGLTKVGYPLVEVIVVDDESSDATPRIVENFHLIDRRIRLVRVENRPSGWAPKPYALSLGAEKAEKGEILFFMDADTRITSPEHFQLLIGMPVEGSEIIALIPRFSCKTFYCKAAQAFMTGTVHAFYGFHRVANPGDHMAWMYGCCWMIRKAYYRSLGGHSLVKDSVVEDRDFASRAKALGAVIKPVEAVRTIEVETYETMREYRSLLARLSLDRAKRLGPRRIMAEAGLIAFLHIAPCAWPLLLVLGLTTASTPFLVAWLAQRILYARGSLYNKYNPLYTLPALWAGLTPSLLGLIDAAKKNKVVWRGRLYS